MPRRLEGVGSGFCFDPRGCNYFHSMRNIHESFPLISWTRGSKQSPALHTLPSLKRSSLSLASLVLSKVSVQDFVLTPSLQLFLFDAQY